MSIPIEYLADVLPKLTRILRLSKILDNEHAPVPANGSRRHRARRAGTDRVQSEHDTPAAVGGRQRVHGAR